MTRRLMARCARGLFGVRVHTVGCGAPKRCGANWSVVQAERPLLTIGCAVVESTNQCEGHFLLSFGTFPFGAIAQLADLPVYRAEGESGGLIGILPVFVGNCTKAEDGFACERVVGGTGSNPGYWYWGDETQLPRPLPEAVGALPGHDPLTGVRGSMDSAVRASGPRQAGRMFWLMRKRFSGSY
jgi:hypothetical protein